MTKPRADQRPLCGFFLLDKPRGMTSNRALQQAKRLFAASKAGHCGSLDPLATGLLPIAFGAATRLTPFLLDAHKMYQVTAKLGTATNTGDADGIVNVEAPVPALTASLIEAESTALVGEIEQLPPMYSALKHRGRRLYELARRGLEVERTPRRVRIFDITAIAYDEPELSFVVRCSKGTYVRTLVEDFARLLGTVGHVVALRRLEVGPFAAQGMHSLDELAAEREQGPPAALDRFLLPMQSALAGWPAVTVTAEQARCLVHGQAVATEPGQEPGRVCLYAPGERFIGIGEIDPDSGLLPRRILVQSEPGDCADVRVQYRASSKG